MEVERFVFLRAELGICSETTVLRIFDKCGKCTRTQENDVPKRTVLVVKYKKHEIATSSSKFSPAQTKTSTGLFPVLFCFKGHNSQ